MNMDTSHKEEGTSRSKAAVDVAWLLAVAFPAGLIVVLLVYYLLW